MVKNMMVVLTVERYTMAKGVSARMTGKSKLLYMIGLCICVLNKSENLVTVYDFSVRVKEMSKTSVMPSQRGSPLRWGRRCS